MPTIEANGVKSYSVKETAAEMRKALRAAFPGVKFSVTMARGSAYGWIDVSWTDGPTSEMVEPHLARFESSRFNGMTDGYDRVDDSLIAFEGEDMPTVVRWGCRGALAQRDHTPAAQAWVAEHVARAYPETSERWEWRQVEIEGVDIHGETVGTGGLVRLALARLDFTGRTF